MRKILMISNMYPSLQCPRFGIFISREVEALSSYCKVTVFSPRAFFRKKEETVKLNENVEVKYPRYFPLPGRFFNFIKGLWFFLFLFLPVLKLKSSFNFNLIHAQRIFPEGVAAVLLGKVFNKRVVVAARGSDINFNIGKFLIEKQIGFVFKKADKVVVVSKSLKEKVKKIGAKDSKIFLMQKGVDRQMFNISDKNKARKKINLPEGKIIILYVGNFVMVKNPLALVNAFIDIKNKDKYLFVMIGDGPLKKEVEAEINKNNFSSFFILTGNIQPADIPLWMNAADMLVLPSLNEGMPNVLYEAFACGLPVIASSVGGVPEIIEKGVNGLLFDVNSDRLSEKIDYLAANNRLRETFSQKGLEFIENNELSWQKNAEKVNLVYEKLLGKCN